MSSNGGRPLAPHVAAAIAGAMQPKVAEGGGRKFAPHVQAAIAGAMQPKVAEGGGGRKFAPHVQAAIAGGQAKLKGGIGRTDVYRSQRSQESNRMDTEGGNAATGTNRATAHCDHTRATETLLHGEVLHAKMTGPTVPANVTLRCNRGRSGGTHAIQAYVPVYWEQYRKGRSTARRYKPAKDFALLSDYVRQVRNEFIHASAHCHQDHHIPLERAYNEFNTIWTDHGDGNNTYRHVKKALNSLVDEVNAALSSWAYVGGEPTDFDKPSIGGGEYKSTDWRAGPEDAISTFGMLEKAAAVRLQPRLPNRPTIPVVGWNQAKLLLPWNLTLLVREIYAHWRTARVDAHGEPVGDSIFDMRIRGGDEQKSLAVGRAGAMRSKHMDEYGLLPVTAAPPDVVGQDNNNVLAYKKWVSTNSSIPHNMAEAAEGGAEGYVEYTGTGHSGDTTQIRVLLDYYQGHIYICYHYQLWDANATPHLHGKNPDTVEGKNNPWLKIDMTGVQI